MNSLSAYNKLMRIIAQEDCVRMILAGVGARDLMFFVDSHLFDFTLLTPIESESFAMGSTLWVEE